MTADRLHPTVLAPVDGSIKPALMRELAERAGRADFARFEAQLRSTGYCARPVRLRGQIVTCDGHGRRRVWSTDSEPDGILRKACGNRREAVCPPCAERYRQDAYQLIAAGMRGGKGVPDGVTDHPALFVTLTAPGFGAVHTRPLDAAGKPRRCRLRRDAPVCEHGLRLSCARVHGEDDPCLGEPICPDCFDHEGAVMWNNALSELWRRTVPVYLPRTLARHASMTQARLRELVRVAYVKVAEYQRRGLVHLHAVIRLDLAMPAYRAHEVHPPPPRFDMQLLEDALRATVGEVDAPLPAELGGGRVRWGDELDIRQLDLEGRREVAAYLAKYATKSTEQAGGILHPVTEHQVDQLPVRDHVRRYLRAAFTLAEDPAVADRRLGACAHQHGYRGHCLTKSRRYSTTFKALREAREQHVHEQILARSQDVAQRAIAGASERVASFRYIGHGHITAADAFLAASAAARAREERAAARLERAIASQQRPTSEEGGQTWAATIE
jgi:hypothetical protein